MEMDHAVTESALVQQLEPEADVVGQGWIAASHDDGGEKQMAYTLSLHDALPI